jgi:hypothetical protein
MGLPLASSGTSAGQGVVASKIRPVVLSNNLCWQLFEPWLRTILPVLSWLNVLASPCSITGVDGWFCSSRNNAETVARTASDIPHSQAVADLLRSILETTPTSCAAFAAFDVETLALVRNSVSLDKLAQRI